MILQALATHGPRCVLVGTSMHGARIAALGGRGPDVAPVERRWLGAVAVAVAARPVLVWRDLHRD